jgi:hypothetical protein
MNNAQLLEFLETEVNSEKGLLTQIKAKLTMIIESEKAIGTIGFCLSFLKQLSAILNLKY